MQHRVYQLVYVFVSQIVSINPLELVASKSQNSKVEELFYEVIELIPRVKQILVKIEIHAISDHLINLSLRSKI